MFYASILAFNDDICVDYLLSSFDNDLVWAAFPSIDGFHAIVFKLAAYWNHYDCLEASDAPALTNSTGVHQVCTREAPIVRKT